MVIRFSTVLAAALALSTAATAQTAPRTVLLGDYFGIRTVEVTVAGETGQFLFDTGGGVSVISPALAEKAGCTPFAQITGFRLSGERLTMPRCDDLAITAGGEALTVPSAGVFDLTSLLPPEAPRIEGLIALDVLADRPFTLELGAGRLTFETPGSLAARIATAVELPVRFHRQAGGISLTVMARVPTAQGDLWMQLDSGSDGALQVARTSAGPLGLAADVERQPLHLKLTGADGREVAAHVEARVRDMIIDGNIGLPVMKDWIMTFDLAEGRLWVQPTPPASTTGAR
ncbi:aspartyl protease family protein [Brevundimonas sp. LjRoot202]|uniref:aspartyl protease family protein n=1 Tax=Brevundimonas sp. LjRoot202 TaxID=3342281 RepID=UPI003ECF9902